MAYRRSEADNYKENIMTGRSLTGWAVQVFWKGLYHHGLGLQEFWPKSRVPRWDGLGTLPDQGSLFAWLKQSRMSMEMLQFRLWSNQLQKSIQQIVGKLE